MAWKIGSNTIDIKCRSAAKYFSLEKKRCECFQMDIITELHFHVANCFKGYSKSAKQLRRLDPAFFLSGLDNMVNLFKCIFYQTRQL